MNNRRVIVKVPASTANLGPGFDTLGMALSLYAWIEMSVADQTEFQFYGDQLKGLPKDKSNLIYKVAQLVFKEAGVAVPELSISMHSDIPLTRGLGSSASAIVGALVAANALIGSPLPDDKLFQMATALEGHPDNVGASLFGGIVVSAWDGERADYIRLEPHHRLKTLVAIPAFQLSTEKARHALPQQISMADAIYNVGRSSLLVAALASGELGIIRHAMKDRLHQPYRAALIPGMTTILERAVEHGALGVALSGAGPTLIAFVEDEDNILFELPDSGSEIIAADDYSDKTPLEQFLLNTLKQEGIDAKTLWLSPCVHGPQITIEDVSKQFAIPLPERIKGDVKV